MQFINVYQKVHASEVHVHASQYTRRLQDIGQAHLISRQLQRFRNHFV